MNVLLVSGDFAPWGGMDRANYELAWYMANETGADVHLVAHSVAEPLASHPRVTWQRVPKPLNSYFLASPLLARYGRAAARSVQSRGGSVVVNGGNCLWPDINWVHAVHCVWRPRVDSAPLAFKLRHSLARRNALWSEQRALKMARIVIANSEQTRTNLIHKLGIPEDRIHTIYFGTDPNVFRPASGDEKRATRRELGWPEQRPTALFIGTLGYDRNKGFDVLFAAWQRLCADAAWDVDLVAAGGGSEVSYWQRKAEQAGLGERTRVLGFTKKIPDLLRAADLLVHPSFYDAYGLSVHEAICCGVPALVTRSAGVAERYPAGLSDLLLDSPPSVENLVDRLQRWRVHREEFRARTLEFSAKLGQRTWTDMAREFVEIAMPTLVNRSVLS